MSDICVTTVSTTTFIKNKIVQIFKDVTQSINQSTQSVKDIINPKLEKKRVQKYDKFHNLATNDNVIPKVTMRRQRQLFFYVHRRKNKWLDNRLDYHQSTQILDETRQEMTIFWSCLLPPPKFISQPSN